MHFYVSFLLLTMNIERLKKNPTLFRRFVGISLDRFEHLVVLLQKIYSKHEKKNVYPEAIDFVVLVVVLILSIV